AVHPIRNRRPNGAVAKRDQVIDCARLPISVAILAYRRSHRLRHHRSLIRLRIHHSYVRIRIPTVRARAVIAGVAGSVVRISVAVEERIKSEAKGKIPVESEPEEPESSPKSPEPEVAEPVKT